MEFESFEDMKKFLDDLGYEIQPKESKKRTMSNAEKQKAYRERKKVTEGNESVTKSNERYEEKREEKEEVLPLSSPSSLSSSPLIPPNNNPITPYNPPLPEEREERKEPDMGVGAKPKHRHGEFGHVLLTDNDIEKLMDKFPDYEERIQRLDDYLEMHKKKHYDNHYLTILNWARKDGKQEKKPEPDKPFDYMAVLKDMTWEGCDG